MLIYSTDITSRLRWIATTLLGNEVAFTSSKEDFIVCETLKINYSFERISNDEFFIQPNGLLSQTTIQSQLIECFKWNGLTVFFKTIGDIPFDIFAAAFYLLSRYEEYLPHIKDNYGRYAAANSLAYKENFLHLPLVNLWMKEWEKEVNAKWQIMQGNAYQFCISTFSFIPTYDIDIAYAYLHQPILKNVIGFYKDLLKTDFDKVLERATVYSNKKTDPFDVYNWLDALHEKMQLTPIYFFLTCIKKGKYDKNLTIRNKALQQLYRQLAAKYSFGIHPSWKSGDDELQERLGKKQKHNLLLKEIQALNKLTEQPIKKSRQHYLRFEIPHTFRKLISVGITEEYSMGYGGSNGFRASYCLPYYWYDIEKESITSLQLHSLCFMDANAIFKKDYSVDEAAIELKQYFDIVKLVGGEFICLFHNHFLTEQKEWLEWRRLYENFLKTTC